MGCYSLSKPNIAVLSRVSFPVSSPSGLNSSALGLRPGTSPERAIIRSSYPVHVPAEFPVLDHTTSSDRCCDIGTESEISGCEP